MCRRNMLLQGWKSAGPVVPHSPASTQLTSLAQHTMVSGVVGALLGVVVAFMVCALWCAPLTAARDR